MPVPTNFGFRSYDAYELLPSTYSTTYGLWRCTEGAGTAVMNRGIPGTGDLALSGAQVSTIWETSNRLFGNASLEFEGNASDRIATSPYSANINLSGATKLSWCAWVRPASAGENNQGRIFVDPNQLIVRVTAGEQIDITMDMTGAAAANKTSSAFLDYASPEWVFLCFTYDQPTAKLYYGYPDDADVTVDYTDTTTWPAGVLETDANDITIGDIAAKGFAFDGLIAETMLVPNKVFSASTVTDIFTRPWMYFSQRPKYGRTHGLAPNVLRQNTADGGFIGVQIAPALETFARDWDPCLDTDWRTAYDYFKEVLGSGSRQVFVLDTADLDSDTERLCQVTNNPFPPGTRRETNNSAMKWDFLEIG